MVSLLNVILVVRFVWFTYSTSSWNWMKLYEQIFDRFRNRINPSDISKCYFFFILDGTLQLCIPAILQDCRFDQFSLHAFVLHAGPIAFWRRRNRSKIWTIYILSVSGNDNAGNGNKTNDKRRQIFWLTVRLMSEYFCPSEIGLLFIDRQTRVMVMVLIC